MSSYHILIHMHALNVHYISLSGGGGPGFIILVVVVVVVENSRYSRTLYHGTRLAWIVSH